MRKILIGITVLAVLVGLHLSNSNGHGHEADTFAISTVLAWIAIAFFLIPTLIAYRRNHPSKLAISLVNLLLGWSGIGWIVALIWSATNANSGAPQQVVINNHYSPPPSQ